LSRPHALIAVVDDEDPVRKALKRLLCSAGFDAHTFASGAEFLASLAGEQPDCIVLDLHMARLNGFEVQARMAQSGVRVPIVVITGHDTPESRQRVMSAGASAYLRKPVDDQALLDAVTAAIGTGSSGGGGAKTGATQP
jgi:FixJ family two-component response regulator